MKRPIKKSAQSGFTLIELMVALGIFLVICGAAFTLLGTSQQRYQSDSQVLNSFQEARLGMDQIVRDVNDSGFPPPSSFTPIAAAANPNLYASTPFAWSTGYPSNPCSVGTSGTCLSPSNFDLIIETNITPQIANSPVMWVRYQLDTTTNTLKRGIRLKVSTDDPLSDFTSADMVPYIQNVMNNMPNTAASAQLAQVQASYPNMFPGGNAVPIFSYFCDTPSSGALPCSSPFVSNHSPQNIRSVSITLIVMSALPDAQTGQPRLVELNGLGRRINPNQ
jgi:prepilin-type N-terminal cleavage/methylation domain-containing protein